MYIHNSTMFFSYISHLVSQSTILVLVQNQGASDVGGPLLTICATRLANIMLAKVELSCIFLVAIFSYLICATLCHLSMTTFSYLIA